MTKEANNDMLDQTEDAKLAERLMRTSVADRIQGMYRTSDQYVNSRVIANLLVKELGLWDEYVSLSNPSGTARGVIEICITEFEKREGNA
jgi:hypothetical protein